MTYTQHFTNRWRARPLRQWLRILEFQARLLLHRLRHPARAMAGAWSVPGRLQPPPHRYQGYAGPWIEDHFARYWQTHGAAVEASAGPIYLPVFWTDLYLHTQTQLYLPGQHQRWQGAVAELLAAVREAPQGCFTVLEYDHSIWDWHLFPGNVAVFSAGGCGDIPIPLLKGSPAYQSPPKDLRLSFVGRLDGASDTTGLRGRMHAALKTHAHFSQGAHWRELMARSTFSLCPRGLGRTSFRLYEAMSVGSIPIHIWDDVEWLPWQDELDWREFALSIPISRIAELPERLASLDEAQVARMRGRMAELYASHFTLDGTCVQIIKRLPRLRDPAYLAQLHAARGF